ncbi:MAG: lactonase family protein, partial [Planctomycetota bacterium]
GSSVNKSRQEKPHAHSVNVDKAGRFAVVADLGLDQCLVYKLDPDTGTLEANDPPAVSVEPGSGPRHFAFHPSGKFAYVINEMASTLTALDYDADKGTLKPVQTLSTLPKGYDGKDNSTAEVQVHPSGKFVYGSNRGHNSIAIFAVDPKTGKLTYIGNESTQGKIPRNFGIDPTGSFLLAANQDSGTVVVFRIDPQTGLLKATGSVVEAPKACCVKFLEIN